MNERDKFLYPKKTYHGPLGSEGLLFDANLQEFSQKVGYLCSLENSGKISQDDAYRQIKELWKELKQSRKSLAAQQIDAEHDGDS